MLARAHDVLKEHAHQRQREAHQDNAALVSGEVAFHAVSKGA